MGSRKKLPDEIKVLFHRKEYHSESAHAKFQQGVQKESYLLNSDVFIILSIYSFAQWVINPLAVKRSNEDIYSTLKLALS